MPKQSQFTDSSAHNCHYFWQLWQSHQGYLYNCCLKWLNGNYHDAEDVVNHAMLKAWNQWIQSTNDIRHPKSWLAQITYNCCIDFRRKRQRESAKIDNIDDVQLADHPALTSNLSLPESQLLNVEMAAYLKYKIASLPDRLRYPLILHCCQNKSYGDIAKQLTISEKNVRKCIQEARQILQKQFKKYLAGEDNTAFDYFFPLNTVIPMVEELESEQIWNHDCESSIPTKSQQQEIDYKATLICLESLPNHWYN
ncbi:RNA polymerase sigma factor [Aphanizomenon sp. CS-733/32]|nr:RNA polymerase sigma factor [Aphanizomenon sp. CS-733/32]